MSLRDFSGHAVLSDVRGTHRLSSTRTVSSVKSRFQVLIEGIREKSTFI